MARRAGALLCDGAPRLDLRLVIFMALAPLLLADEILGRVQFDELCRERAVLTLHASRLPGRWVEVASLPPENVPGHLLPVREQRWVYTDTETREPLLSFSILQAQGGRLVRMLGWPRDAPPLSFAGRCAPTARHTLVNALDLRVSGSSALMRGLSPSP